MNRYRWIWAMTLASAVISASAVSFSQTVKEEKTIYNESADARVEVKEALEKASAEHKRVIVVFGANWCFDCHVLDKAFHSADIAPIIASNYEVVHVDIGRGEKNQDLMTKYDVPMNAASRDWPCWMAMGSWFTARRTVNSRMRERLPRRISWHS